MNNPLRIDGELLPGYGRRDRPDEPVLLLHSLGLDRSVWSAHVEALREYGPVLVCDLPGHGRSDPLTGPVTVEEMADAVARFLDAHGIDQVTVAGLSLGGCVAQALTFGYPGLVRRIVLVDTTAWYGPNAQASWEERAIRAAEEGLASMANFQLRRWFSPAYPEQNPDLCNRLLAVFRANDLRSYQETCRAMGIYDGRDRLHAIAVPAVVMVGELDPATPVDHARVLATSIPGARLYVLPQTSHLSPVERPEAFRQCLIELLSR
jgi:3-oxoadipate enol-lactonase